MKMNNSQINNNNVIYQYNVTANSDINYADVPKMSYTNNTQKPPMQRETFEPALKRAELALKLVNPFKGV